METGLKYFLITSEGTERLWIRSCVVLSDNFCGCFQYDFAL